MENHSQPKQKQSLPNHHVHSEKEHLYGIGGIGCLILGFDFRSSTDQRKGTKMPSKASTVTMLQFVDTALFCEQELQEIEVNPSDRDNASECTYMCKHHPECRGFEGCLGCSAAAF